MVIVHMAMGPILHLLAMLNGISYNQSIFLTRGGWVNSSYKILKAFEECDAPNITIRK
jgi:hypothetical protein